MIISLTDGGWRFRKGQRVKDPKPGHLTQTCALNLYSGPCPFKTVPRRTLWVQRTMEYFTPKWHIFIHLLKSAFWVPTATEICEEVQGVTERDKLGPWPLREEGKIVERWDWNTIVQGGPGIAVRKGKVLWASGCTVTFPKTPLMFSTYWEANSALKLGEKFA